jgi:S-adenosylmethionine hydrolase
MLIHLIADFGQADLAFAEVVQRLKCYLPQAELLMTSVPPFATLAAGFCAAQLALNPHPEGMLIFHNVAPRRDDARGRRNNDGERLAVTFCNGVTVVGVNAGYAFSFFKGEAPICAIDVPAGGSQFRSRDIFPQAVARLVSADAAISTPLNDAEVPDVPAQRVAYIDGFGNIKTTIPAGHYRAGELLAVTIGDTRLTLPVSDASFAVPQGQLTLAVGSSGWQGRGGRVQFMELFLRGGSAAAHFGHPEPESAIHITRLSR